MRPYRSLVVQTFKQWNPSFSTTVLMGDGRCLRSPKLLNVDHPRAMIAHHNRTCRGGGPRGALWALAMRPNLLQSTHPLIRAVFLIGLNSRHPVDDAKRAHAMRPYRCVVMQVFRQWNPSFSN